MDLSIGKILGHNYFNPSKLPDESDLPSSPSPYPRASSLDDQEPSLQQAMRCSQTEPDFWTMWNERWDLVEPLSSTEGDEEWDLVEIKPLVEPLLSTEVESAANRIKSLSVKNEKNEETKPWSITELEAPNFLLSREVNQIIGGTIPTSFQEILPTKSVTRRARDSHCSYKKAKWVVKQKGITTRDEYRASFQKELRPEGLPYNPDNYYGEWNGWDVFLPKRTKPLPRLRRKKKICSAEKVWVGRPILCKGKQRGTL